MPTISKADQSARISQNEARRRKELALAELREMEVAEKAGRLIAAERVTDAWTKILASVKSAVLRIPDNCAIAVSAATDAREARNILAGECEVILRNLADEVRRLAPSGDTGRGKRIGTAGTREPGRVGKRALPPIE